MVKRALGRRRSGKISASARLEDVLFTWRQIGHYRYF